MISKNPIEIRRQYQYYIKELKKHYKFTLITPIEMENSFFDLLHCNSKGRYISSMYKLDDRMFTYHFPKEKMIMNGFQSYFSLNTFIRPKRTIENLFEYTCCFVDLDIYTKNITRNEALSILVSDYFGISIPNPTYVIDSGNGLYLIWQFMDTVPARNSNGFNNKVFNMWNALQRELCNRLTELGSDSNCLDASRVLRNTGTYNTKYGSLKEVSFLFSSGKKYDMNIMADEILPPLIKNKEKSKKRKKREFTPKVTDKRITSNYNLHLTNHNRLNDFVKLIDLRNGHFPQRREKLIFLFRCSANRLYDQNIALDMTLKLNAKLYDRLTEHEVINSTKSANRNERDLDLFKKVDTPKGKHYPGYNFTSETLIEFLDITLEEQEHMLTICNKNIKMTRHNTNRRTKRRNENGLTKREQSKINNIFLVHILKEKGLKNAEIMKITDLSKGIVYKYYKLQKPNISDVSSSFIKSNIHLRTLEDRVQTNYPPLNDAA